MTLPMTISSCKKKTKRPKRPVKGQIESPDKEDFNFILIQFNAKNLLLDPSCTSSATYKLYLL